MQPKCKGRSYDHVKLTPNFATKKLKILPAISGFAETKK
jgi:hypothetical protein